MMHESFEELRLALNSAVNTDDQAPVVATPKNDALILSFEAPAVAR